jgi:hypothetical protein
LVGHCSKFQKAVTFLGNGSRMVREAEVGLAGRPLEPGVSGQLSSCLYPACLCVSEPSPTVQSPRRAFRPRLASGPAQFTKTVACLEKSEIKYFPFFPPLSFLLFFSFLSLLLSVFPFLSFSFPLSLISFTSFFPIPLHPLSFYFLLSHCFFYFNFKPRSFQANKISLSSMLESD